MQHQIRWARKVSASLADSAAWLPAGRTGLPLQPGRLRAASALQSDLLFWLLAQQMICVCQQLRYGIRFSGIIITANLTVPIY